jgi:sigma-B regulation protein RsbU (phosphoserine phosphatase)
MGEGSAELSGFLLNDAGVLQSVFQSIAAGVVVCDNEGRFLCFNREAERILGLGLKDVDEAAWSATYGCYEADGITLFPSEQLPLARALNGEEVLDELILIRNEVQEAGVWISVSGRPFRDVEGNLRGAVAVFHDVTEAQATLQKSRPAETPDAGTFPRPTGFECRSFVEHIERLRGHYDRICSAVEQTADAVVITDSRGVIEYANLAFEQVSGYAMREILGRTPKILKSGKHEPDFYQRLWETLLAGETFRGTIINRKKSGDLYWTQQTITPFRDRNGQATHFVSVQKDVTELRKQQEQEFDLRIAREVQQRYYATEAAFPGFDVAGAAFPASTTGGDYFDFISRPDGSFCIVIGDVSGHGFGAALVMAGTRAYVRSYAQVERDPGVLLRRVNAALCGDLDGRTFVTLLVVRVDPARRRIEYAGAGHVPGYLLGASGELRHSLDSDSVPLGLLPCAEFPSADPIELNNGDTIVLLTDGAVESPDLDLEFGAARVLKYVEGHLKDSAKNLVQGICAVARNLSGGEPQHDDIMAVVCKVAGG